MKIYLRILRYAPHIIPRIIQFFLYAIVGIVFGLFNFLLMIPLLRVLFNKTETGAIQKFPNFSISIQYLIDTFHYYFTRVIVYYGKPQALLFVCLVIIASTLISNLFRYFERITASRIKVDVVKNMRMHIFANTTNLHIGYFNSQRKGDLISRFTNDVAEVEAAVVNSLKSVMKEPVAIIFHFAALFYLSPQLTFFTLLVLPITGGILAEIIKRLKRKAIQSQESLGRIVNILDEVFGGMRVIKAFNARNFILKKLDQETSYHRKVNLSIAKKNELASPVSETLGIMIMAGILYFGGTLVMGDNPILDAESFLTFLAIFATVLQPAKSFSNGITSVQKGTVSAQRIFDVIDTEPVVKNIPNAKVLPMFNHSIEFKNVGFAYDKDLVLQNINLKIEKGKTIALVGPSGGGKSTLADLVPRFYDPSSGEVLIDGIPIYNYDIDSLRHHIGVVTQEAILFNDSIFNNIAFGMDNVNEEDVIHAAKVANAHEFIIQTEFGYNTFIGERGSKLSGGQRQRLSIARAVLKNPPILILDEATSALDSESERLVQDALTRLMEHRTSIVIAHRLSTIQHADEIIVIQQGQIVERGTHTELLLNAGLYKKLNEIQGLRQ